MLCRPKWIRKREMETMCVIRGKDRRQEMERMRKVKMHCALHTKRIERKREVDLLFSLEAKMERKRELKGKKWKERGRRRWMDLVSVRVSCVSADVTSVLILPLARNVLPPPVCTYSKGVAVAWVDCYRPF